MHLIANPTLSCHQHSVFIKEMVIKYSGFFFYPDPHKANAYYKALPVLSFKHLLGGVYFLFCIKCNLGSPKYFSLDELVYIVVSFEVANHACTKNRPSSSVCSTFVFQVVSQASSLP